MKLLDAQGIAAKMSVSRSTVYSMIKTDPLFPAPSHKLFGNSQRGYRWEEADIDRYLEDTRFPRITLRRTA